MSARRLLRFQWVAPVLLLTAVFATMQPASSNAASSVNGCPHTSPYTTPVGALNSSRHPLVLIHGWTGTSDGMGPVEQGLNQRLPNYFDFRYFDYRENRTDWAAHLDISACLADYVNTISAAHKRAGGDGKVYVVTHSMGGLAIRFATDRSLMPSPVQASELGGVVTLDTPHLGSVFGNTPEAALLQTWSEHHGTPLLPGHTSDAQRCLALHGPSQPLPSGCANPPWLPGGVPLAEASGTETVRRTVFGIHLYDIPLWSDGAVGVDSSHGYLTSTAGRAPQAHVTLPAASCSVTTDETMNLLWAAAKSESLPQAIIDAELKAIDLLRTDGKILDAIDSGTLTPELTVMLGVEAQFLPCGHVNIVNNPDALDGAATALREDIAAAGVTVHDLLSAPVPPACRHPAGTLHNGTLTVAPGTGYEFLQTRQVADAATTAKTIAPAFADLTGDSKGDAAAVLSCSAGGVSWPDSVLFYGPGPTLLGSVDLFTVHPAEHARVSSLRASNGDVLVAWQTTEGCCSFPMDWTARLHYDGSKVQILDAKQVGGYRRTATTIDATAVDGGMFTTPNGNVTCDVHPRSGKFPGGYTRCDATSRTFTPPPPTMPGCIDDYGYAVGLDRSAQFICVPDTIAGMADTLSARVSTWRDSSQDPEISTPRGPNAVLRLGMTFIADPMRCTSTADGVACQNTATHAQFTLSPGAYSINN